MVSILRRFGPVPLQSSCNGAPSRTIYGVGSVHSAPTNTSSTRRRHAGINQPQMYSPVDVLRATYNLNFSSAASLRLEHDQFCAVCKVPPSPRGLFYPDRQEAWLRDFGHLAGRITDGAGMVNPAAMPAPALRMNLREDSTRCLTCESQLRPACAIPDNVLVLIRRELSHDELFFVEDQLLFAICGVCAMSDRATSENGQTLMKRYVDIRCGGDPQVLATGGFFAAAQALASRVDSAVKQVSV